MPFNSSNLNTTQTNLSLTYYPRPYVVSPYRGPLTTVWYLDYAHLLFWFFFLNLFVTFLVLVFFFLALSRYTELREVVRETRGFSRAQTGDLLTATMPLTWSATMIIHANTHSSNFDENTSLTSLALSIIAYQWGWNYFFPVDVAYQLTTHPMRVGRSATYHAQGVDSYAELAANARTEYWLKLSARGKYVGKQGRGSIGHVSGFYANSAQADKFDLPLFSVINTTNVDWAQSTKSRFAIACASLPTPGDVNTDALRQRHAPYFSQLNKLGLTTLRSIVLPFASTRLSTATSSTDLGVSQLAENSAVNRSNIPTSAAAVYALPSTKARASTFIVGNRLSVITKHLSEPTLSKEHLCKYNLAQHIKHLETRTVGAIRFGTSSGVNFPETWIAPLGDANLRITPYNTFTGTTSTPASMLTFKAQTPESTLSRKAGLSALGLIPTGASNLTTSDLGGAGSSVLAEQAARLSAETHSVDLNTILTNNVGTCNVPGTIIESGLEIDVANSTYNTTTKLPTSVQNFIEMGQASKHLSMTPPQISTFNIDMLSSWADSTGLTAETFSSQPSLSISLTNPRMGGVNLHTGLHNAVCNAKQASDLVMNTADNMAPFLWSSGPGEDGLARSNADANSDPYRVNSKLNDLASVVSPLDTLLYNWQWRWASPLRNFSFDKFYRGALLSRPVSAYWSAARLVDLDSRFSSQASTAYRFDKATNDVVTTELPRLNVASWFPELGSSVLDNERSFLNPVFALTVPAPYLDLDPAFMISRWTMGVNTTRRGNHAAKYRLSWGSGLSKSINAESSLIQEAAMLPTTVTPSLFSTTTTKQIALSALLDRSGFLAHQANAVPSITLRERSVTDGVFKMPHDLLQQLSASTTNLNSGNSFNVSILNKISAWSLLNQRGSKGFNLSQLSTGFWPAYLELRLSFASNLRNVNRSFVQNNLIADKSAEIKAAALSTSLLSDSATKSRHGFLATREDISSLRRLRLTRGLCLPAVTPIHGIFGSKDVIHSWAIPGLGLKVDCVPGYNSHRRLFFAWRGAYWGQCMEVCGRYHHWMPILVRITHRDSFLSWCLTYVDGLRLTVDQSASNNIQSQAINVLNFPALLS